MNIRKRIAIFDTNVIDGEKNTDSFFGGRQELERFSTICEIVIPDMVIEEIKKHKFKYLISEKSKFSVSPFRFLLGLKQEDIDVLDINQKIDELYTSEQIAHSVIKLSLPDGLERIKTMCLENEAPFEPYKDKNATDKGFKDAYILLTIEEFKATQPDAEIFVVVRDERLTEALKKLTGINVIKDFDEFELLNTSKFTEDYFLQRLSEITGEDITAELILSADFNINDNWVLEVRTADKPTFVEVDFKNTEIIDFAKVGLKVGINGLINSGSFATTHEWIQKLNERMSFLSIPQIISLVETSVLNDQIYQIHEDEDVKEFFYILFEKVQNLIQEDLATSFINKFKYERR